MDQEAQYYQDATKNDKTWGERFTYLSYFFWATSLTSIAFLPYLASGTTLYNIEL